VQLLGRFKGGRRKEEDDEEEDNACTSHVYYSTILSSHLQLQTKAAPLKYFWLNKMFLVPSFYSD
jgi:hypothetical protein